MIARKAPNDFNPAPRRSRLSRLMGFLRHPVVLSTMSLLLGGAAVHTYDRVCLISPQREIITAHESRIESQKGQITALTRTLEHQEGRRDMAEGYASKMIKLLIEKGIPLPANSQTEPAETQPTEPQN